MCYYRDFFYLVFIHSNNSYIFIHLYKASNKIRSYFYIKKQIV
jgi:hypothetical protein